MVSIPNIYTSKHLKYFIVVPVLLMLIGIYFSTKIILDSSLSGGVSIILQTNSTMSTSQLATAIASKLHIPQPNIQRSPGGLQITLITNESLSKAESLLLSFYAYKATYSGAQVNATAFSLALEKAPGNKTLEAELGNSTAILNSSLAGMRETLGEELLALSPFIGSAGSTANSTSAMTGLAQDSYTNASLVYRQKVLGVIGEVIPYSSYSYQQLTPTLGRYFLGQLRYVIFVAFVLIIIVVFAIFRSVAPAFAVVFGAANDMVIALGAMGVLGIPLGIASIGGLLMLIGYSIDTDVLTAIRILKRHEGTPEERAYSSMKTGLTMTTTALVSFGVLFIVSILAYIPTYYEISGVVLFGLLGDILTTWLGNATIVLLYKKRKERR